MTKYRRQALLIDLLFLVVPPPIFYAVAGKRVAVIYLIPFLVCTAIHEIKSVKLPTETSADFSDPADNEGPNCVMTRPMTREEMVAFTLKMRETEPDFKMYVKDPETGVVEEVVV